jgi:putative transposase
MTNHVHLLATAGDEQGMSRLLQALGRRYVEYFNFTYGRTGTLWQGRYKSTLVDSDSYLLTVYRYIELNPVRACMVSRASEYPWSSYRSSALSRPIQFSRRILCNSSSVKHRRNDRMPTGHCSAAECRCGR